MLSTLVGLVAEAVAARLGDRDDLVALAAEPLASMGLEHAAVLRLVADGKLRAVTIGRRRFTKRSYLLALVDELAPEERQPAPTAEPSSDLRDAVRAMARRSARKHMRAVEGGKRGAA